MSQAVNRISSRAVQLPVLILCLTLSACTQNIAYRQVDLPRPVASLDQCKKFGGALEHSGEPGSDYFLGFVEVDDQGVFFSRDQFKNLACDLSSHAESSGALISVFVHGWHHNATDGDENIEDFKGSLVKLSQLEHLFAKKTGGIPRKTIGVYMGWRGESIAWDWLSYLTFWERKNTAEEIANRSISEALLNLEKIANTKSLNVLDNRLFIVGHSFGAAVVYNALSPIMLERLVNDKKLDCKLKGFGDFVFLVNPAFEAMQYVNFLGIFAGEKNHCNNQFPVFAVLTSLNDEATKYAFPFGRKFSTLFETYRDMEIPGNDGTTMTVGQGNLDTSAIGHEKILNTHSLKSNPEYKNNEQTDDVLTMAGNDCEVVKQLRDGWVNGQKNYILNEVILTNSEKYNPYTPYLIINVDQQLIPDHTKIYDSKVLNFMRRLVVMSTQEEVCANSQNP